MKHLQVVDGHLQDLSFLQLGRALHGEGDSCESSRYNTQVAQNVRRGVPAGYLLLKRAGNQSAELAQAVVDSVAAPFFDDLANDTACYNTCVRLRFIRSLHSYLLRDAFSSPAPELMWWETWTPEENSCSFKEMTQGTFTLRNST